MADWSYLMKEPTTYTKPNTDNSKPGADAMPETSTDRSVQIDKANAELTDEKRLRATDDQQPSAAEPETSRR
jgi:hypothetical protein